MNDTHLSIRIRRLIIFFHSCPQHMDSTKPEVLHDLFPLLRVYKDGSVERLMGTETVPASLDPKTDVQSKDVVYSREADLSARLYLPRTTNHNQKLPLLVYYHGGRFCMETAFSPTYHNYLNTLVSEANIIAVSVDYRRAPEHHLPAAYDDSWAALKWAGSHVNGDGPEQWLNCHVDFGKVFLAGDSAGGNIAHNMARRFDEEKLDGVDLMGIVLIHPYFWGNEPIGNEPKEAEKRASIEGFWRFACPASSGCDDPLINPAADPRMASLGCTWVLVLVAEKDFLRDRGWHYYEKLGKSGWGGKVEIMEAKEEGHVFHLFNPSSENSVAVLKKIVSFIHQDVA